MCRVVGLCIAACVRGSLVRTLALPLVHSSIDHHAVVAIHLKLNRRSKVKVRSGKFAPSRAKASAETHHSNGLRAGVDSPIHPQQPVHSNWKFPWVVI